MASHDNTPEHDIKVLASTDLQNMNADEIQLARVGHKQQLVRRFSLWTIVALCLCLLATWEAVSATLVSSLVSGGPVTVIWGFLIGWIFALMQALSLAEISSIYPTSGGQYHWTACLSPPSISKSARLDSGLGFVGCFDCVHCFCTICCWCSIAGHYHIGTAGFRTAALCCGSYFLGDSRIRVACQHLWDQAVACVQC